MMIERFQVACRLYICSRKGKLWFWPPQHLKQSNESISEGPGMGEDEVEKNSNKKTPKKNWKEKEKKKRRIKIRISASL